jgi:hypothetical protein
MADVTLKDQQHAGRLNVDQTTCLTSTSRKATATYQITISRIPRSHDGVCLFWRQPLTSMAWEDKRTAADLKK